MKLGEALHPHVIKEINRLRGLCRDANDAPGDRLRQEELRGRIAYLQEQLPRVRR